MKNRGQKNIKYGGDAKYDAKYGSRTISSKNGGIKGLATIKSQKELGKKIGGKEDKNTTGSSIVVVEIVQSGKGSTKINSKQLLDKEIKNSKDENKMVLSPKFSSHILSKVESIPNNLLSKTRANEKQIEQLKKQLIEKDEKLKILQKKNEQLQITIKKIQKQLKQQQQTIQKFKIDKDSLQKNLQKLKNVLSQNKKLLKEKADRFNYVDQPHLNFYNKGQEQHYHKNLIKMCEIGINTSMSQIVMKTNNNAIHKGQHKIVRTYEFYTSQGNQFDLKNQKTNKCNQVDQNTTVDSLSLISIKNFYEKVVAEKNGKIQERDELIYQQQCELNEFYEKKQNQNRKSEIIKGRVDQTVLSQAQEICSLKNLLTNQSESRHKMTEEMREKEREIENLKRQIQIKGVVTELSQNRKTNTKCEIEKLSRELQQLKSAIEHKQDKIKELESQNLNQCTIIKSLREMKSKVIVK